jgi:hypothetical protein
VTHRFSRAAAAGALATPPPPPSVGVVMLPGKSALCSD